jgi:glycosyltransferase involved in cell wall biosynthesis
VPVLVRAFRSSCEQGLGARAELHLFGRVDIPALDAELKGLAAGLPVTFHGRFEHEELARARLHCAVFPMVCFETYGFVLDEAFELGLPAIVTDIGAIPVRGGDAVLRVPPRDADALAAAMRRVVEEPAVLARLRAAVGPVGLSTQEHVRRLDQAYARARAAGRPATAWAVPASRRAELLLLQRESAQARVCPEGGPS